MQALEEKKKLLDFFFLKKSILCIEILILFLNFLNEKFVFIFSVFLAMSLKYLIPKF